MCGNTRCINSTRGTSSKKGCPPQWHIYPTFQAHSVTQVCTGIRENQFLFKTGHSPFILKLVQHTNTHIYMLASEWIVTNLKRNEALGAHAESFLFFLFSFFFNLPGVVSTFQNLQTANAAALKKKKVQPNMMPNTLTVIVLRRILHLCS